jgi:hypothetical protein
MAVLGDEDIWIMKCRICDSPNYQSVLDLGMVHPSGFSKSGAVLEKTPLNLVRCLDCGLAQLEESIDLDLMYKGFYWYRSSLNPSMIKALDNVVQSAIEKANPQPGDVVCDIGANDLTLLTLYPNNLIKIAYEPASNLAEYGQFADYYVNDYFTADGYPIDQKAKIITSIAMFYDLESPEKFVLDIARILDPDGIWILQYTDLYETLRNNDFTNICQEHLDYYSTDILIKLFAKYGLEIFDMERNDVNGGSVRLYVRYIKNITKSDNYYLMLGEEMDFLSRQDFLFSSFRTNVESIREKLSKFLDQHKDVYALGASTKSGTLLQYCGIDDSKIKAIGEISEDKIGLKNVTGIPIVHEDDIIDFNPEVIIVLTWQFRWFFLNKLRSYIDNGGTVLFPLPNPEIITRDSSCLL